jgi:hypothetical protein
MDGLFQLLIIVFFVAASIFDAVSRNRKKQEQKERMEAEEEAEAGGGQARPSRPRPARSEGAPGPQRRPEQGREGRRKAPTGRPAEAGGTAPQRRSERRETAETMLPDDFWAILTGQPRPDRTPQAEPSPGEGRGQASGARPGQGDGDDLPRDVRIPVPAPSDRMARDGREAEELSPAATRRSSRWMEGLDTGEPGSEHGEPVLAGTRPRPAARQGTRSFPAAPPRPQSPFARPAPKDPMDEPWGELEDISRGEIGDGRGATQGAVDLYGGEGARRAGASESPYVRLVSTGRQEDLKAAIVLREVLGAPVGSRGPSEGPGGWRWDDL